MRDNKIIYILPTKGLSGGANSVVQETLGMLRLGIDIYIAVDKKNYATFLNNYAAKRELLRRVLPFKDDIQLKELIKNQKFDIVIATLAPWVPRLYKITGKVSKELNKKVRLMYYIQDYEPLFFNMETKHYNDSKKSYEFGDKIIGFAKTDWICRVVKQNHGMNVRRVKASIDNELFFPIYCGTNGDKKIRITAMIRPSTPRRGARRTLRILNQVAGQYNDRVSIKTFGCTLKELDEKNMTLLSSIQHSEILTQDQVAQIMRQTDLFLDLSDYQAFGRTGLEAMACGACSVLPIFGGADEYVLHEENGYLVDVRDDNEIMRHIKQFIELSEKPRAEMRRSALKTASKYSVHRATISIVNVLERTAA